MKNRIYLPLWLFSISLVLCSCFIGRITNFQKAKKAYSVANGGLPVDFGVNSNEIFLPIKMGYKNYDRFLVANVDRIYKGKYEYAIFSRLEEEKYADRSIYRYYFYYDPGRVRTERDADGRETSFTYKAFYLFDRLDSVQYKTGKDFTYFSAAIRAYIRNLEDQRLLNQSK